MLPPAIPFEVPHDEAFTDSIGEVHVVGQRIVSFDPALAQEKPADSPLGPLGSLLPFILIAVLFYFMLIRPERKKRNETVKMLENMKKNDRVVTVGGIYGVVVNVQKDSEDVTLRIDDSTNTRMRVLRSAISRIITDDSEANQQ